METKAFYSFRNHHKCFSQLFLIHLNTYVMGLQPLEIFSLLQFRDRLKSSESDVYRRQILTTEVDPRAVRVKDNIWIIGLKVLNTNLQHNIDNNLLHNCDL